MLAGMDHFDGQGLDVFMLRQLAPDHFLTPHQDDLDP